MSQKRDKRLGASDLWGREKALSPGPSEMDLTGQLSNLPLTLKELLATA